MASRYAIISDIHANSEALAAVLGDIDAYRSQTGNNNEIICLGDLVGYGPDPNEVIETIRSKNIYTVCGNHDKATIAIYPIVKEAFPNGSEKGFIDRVCEDERLCSLLQLNEFNLEAMFAEIYSAANLKPENFDFLRKLSPLPYVHPEGRFAIVHGSFCGLEERDANDPYYRGLFEEAYIMTDHDAADAMASLAFGPDGKIIKHVNASLEGERNRHITRHIMYPSEAIQVPIGIFGHTHNPAFASCVIATAGIDGVYQWDRKNNGITEFEFSLGYGKRPLRKTTVDLNQLPEYAADSKAPAWFAEGSNSYPNFESMIRGLFLRKILVNPGSVGQPRDGTPEAKYLIMELDGSRAMFDFRSVAYDIASVQNKITNAGLPSRLAKRLSEGK